MRRNGDPVEIPRQDLQASAELLPVEWRPVAGHRHLRLEGPHGPRHVWIPPGYTAETGATIVYVHGYFNNVDTAWTAHQLPEQAALSGLNAILIAPEAPIIQKAGVICTRTLNTLPDHSPSLVNPFTLKV